MFKLLRYFSITSFIAFMVVAILSGVLYRYIVINNLVEISESKNVALTQAFSNSLWTEFAPFVASAGELSPEALKNHSQIPQLRQAVLAQMERLSVVKVKVYNLNGLTVFSTEPGQIGEDKSNNGGFIAASQGQVASELTHRDTFSAFEGIVEDRDVFSSYVPIRPDGANGPVEAVFEVYDDVTPLVQRIDRTQTNIVAGAALIFAGLYALLFFIVKRADTIIHRQYNELKQGQQALRQSEARFRQVVTSISDHVYMTEFTHAGEQINHYISPNVEALTGYPLDNFLTDWNFWPSTVIHPDDRPAAATQAKQLFEGKSSKMEYRLVRAGGEIIWVRDSGRAEKNPQTQSTLIYGVVSDITEHKKTEQALHKQQAFLQQVIDINPHYIFAKDRQGRFTLANQAFASAYGTTVEKLLGKTDADFNPNKELIARYNRDDLSVIESGQELYIPEDKVITINGEEKWRQTIKRPIMDENGEIHQVLGVASDITELKLAERKLAWAHQQALEASRLKSQLLANVSHDVRTPLNAILGYTDMLQEGVYGPLSAGQRNAITEIINSAGELLNFVNNLLDQARIESGQVMLKRRAFVPAALIETVITGVGLLAKTKNLELTYNVAADVPPKLRGDIYWLRQILVNLVGNAIKFTEQGSVHISLYLHNSETWAVSVSDTGVGIPAEVQSDIFEPFEQVDGTITRVQGGSGLGLSIVKQLTTLMGGEITLTSKAGLGSKFTILLPLIPVEEKVL